jgi:hypothetical protein
LPDGVLLLSIWAASARAQWWPGRGEKRVTRATAGLALTAALPTSAGRGSALNAQRPNAAPASSATPRPCRPAKPALLGHTSAAGLTKSPAIYLSPSRFRHFAGRPSCNLSPPSFGRSGLFFVTRRLVDGEARSVGVDGPGRSFVRVGDLGPKDKLGLLRRVFGAAQDSVDPGERERVDLIAQGGALDRVRFQFLRLDRPLCCCSQPAA